MCSFITHRLNRGWVTALWLVLFPQTGISAPYPDAERYRPAIEEFQNLSKRTPVSKGGIVATGSSSMGGWHSRIATDLAPLTVIPRGFGGSNMYDVRYFLPELVLQYEPRAVMIYEGDNDAALGASSEQVMLHFKAIVEELHVKLPQTRIYVLAVKPSPSRWHLWPVMAETNKRLAALSETNSLITFIDVATPMLGEDGKPLTSIFVEDMLHMNDKGYDIWRKVVREALIESEESYE
ncbi:MAG TPA: GDSL family lipase [Gammaproteobacteria bacterium]|nr:GDSL family lipase [Gammaproteobacteria bacterium]